MPYLSGLEMPFLKDFCLFPQSTSMIYRDSASFETCSRFDLPPSANSKVEVHHMISHLDHPVVTVKRLKYVRMRFKWTGVTQVRIV